MNDTTHRRNVTGAMPWAWRAATVAGIPIYLHGTFLLLIAFVLISGWLRGRDAAAALAGAIFVLAIFSTVVLHELGHALAARRFGIQTRDITLLPIGGLARLERMPDVPRQELWVALAGPAVNVAIALVTYLGLTALAAGPALSLFRVPEDFAGQFIEVNLWLAAFNMIPAFPMDGGRALRALLAERMDYVRATQAAARLGQGLALVFGFVGLFYNPFLIFIAMFVWMGASTESTATETRFILAGVPVTQAMITDFRTVQANDTVARAVQLVLSTSQRDFPVIDGERVVGILTRDAMTVALASGGPEVAVHDVMERTFETAEATEMLATVYQRLEACRCQVIPVVRAGRLVGLMTPENIAEYVMFRGTVGLRSGRPVSE